MSSPLTVASNRRWAPAVIARVPDYLEIVKPRISLMVLVTVSVGFALGSFGAWQIGLLCQTLLGVTLVATASSALNQVMERKTDALMRRTADRPLPSGRLSRREVITLAVTSGCLGTLWLAWFVNLTTAGLTLLTLALYVLVYTPLKRRSYLCTAFGAIPGALPPVLGWVAAGAPLDNRALALFGILFLWQFPHFLAIAWLHRDDYARAGLRMLPGEGTPRVAGLLSIAHALLLIPVSVIPSSVGLGGSGYFLAALILGVGYLAGSICFAVRESDRTARLLLFTSLVYLPVLLLALVGDHFSLLQ